MLTFYNTEMQSKAGEATIAEPSKDPGAEVERLINRLDIFLYPKDGADSPCLFYKHLSDLSDIGTSTVPVFVSKDIVSQLFPGESAECDVYVVANLPASVTFAGNEKIQEIGAKSILSEEFSQVVDYDGTYSAPANFLMSGQGQAKKGEGTSISGTIPLVRAASKVTLHINIPEFLNVDAITDNPEGEEDIVKKEQWYPYLNQEGNPESGVQAMHIGFHKGLQRTYVSGVNDIKQADKETDIFETQYTDQFSHDLNGEINDPETGEMPGYGDPKVYYNYSCEVTYYT